jgi:thiol-disulfide isomerase/thioredoxin
MKRKILCLSVFLMMLILATAIGAAENSPPKVGSVFPEIELLKPNNPDQLKYLGLSGSGFFKVQQVKSDVVIIEIFNMYCPYCQGEAPNVNRLYASIEGNPALKNKIKIIGIGVNNSFFETEIFKNKYKVEFPLIPDGDFKLYKFMGEVRTPYFIAVKLSGGKYPEVIYSRLGALENNDLFLAQIIKSAGLK